MKKLIKKIAKYNPIIVYFKIEQILSTFLPFSNENTKTDTQIKVVMRLSLVIEKSGFDIDLCH